MQMTLNDKQDCIDSIAKVLERTAAWRKAIAVNFPDDPRNMRAAETLEKLAVDANNLSDEQWSDLIPAPEQHELAYLLPENAVDGGSCFRDLRCDLL